MAERMPLRLADVRSGSVSVTGVPDLGYTFSLLINFVMWDGEGKKAAVQETGQNPLP